MDWYRKPIALQDKREYKDIGVLIRVMRVNTGINMRIKTGNAC